MLLFAAVSEKKTRIGVHNNCSIKNFLFVSHIPYFMSQEGRLFQIV